MNPKGNEKEKGDIKIDEKEKEKIDVKDEIQLKAKDTQKKDDNHKILDPVEKEKELIRKNKFR